MLFREGLRGTHVLHGVAALYYSPVKGLGMCCHAGKVMNVLMKGKQACVFQYPLVPRASATTLKRLRRAAADIQW